MIAVARNLLYAQWRDGEEHDHGREWGRELIFVVFLGSYVQNKRHGTRVDDLSVGT
jgi:hypothetical protein